MENGYFGVRGEIVGHLRQMDDDDETKLVIEVVSWQPKGTKDWFPISVPWFLIRWSGNDLTLIKRGTAWTEESSPGLGDWIEFWTNKEEQQDYVQWQ
jgi:hypothetical protein